MQRTRVTVLAILGASFFLPALAWSQDQSPAASEQAAPAPVASSQDQLKQPDDVTAPAILVTPADLGPTPTLEEIARADAIVDRAFGPAGREPFFVPIGDPPVFAEGRIKRGQVIAAAPVRHARVGVLKSDLTSSDMFAGRLLAAGTSVFRHRGAGAIIGSSAPLDLWCGVKPASWGNPDTNFCFEAKESGIATAYVAGGSPWWPTSFSIPGMSIKGGVSPDVDEQGATSLPKIEIVVTFVEWDTDDVDVRDGVRVNDKVYEMSDRSVKLQPGNNTARMKAFGGELELTRGEDRTVATVKMLSPPVSFDPEERRRTLLALRDDLAMRYAKTRAEGGGAAATRPLPPRVDIVPPPPEGKGRIVLFNTTKFLSNKVSFAVKGDGAAVTRLHPNSYYLYDVEPGRHSLGIDLSYPANLDVEIAAGQILYVEQGASVGAWSARYRLINSSAAAFMSAFNKLKEMTAADLGERSNGNGR
jgi:hypothetical protein